MHSARRGRNAGGFMSVLVLLLIGVFAALATAHFYSATISLRQSKSQADVQAATLEAESGMEFLSYIISQQTLPGGVSGTDLLDALADELSDTLDGTAALGGESTSYADGVISIPAVSLEPGRRFSATVSLNEAGQVVVAVNGRSGSVSRTVAMSFVSEAGSHPVFNYGIAAQGPICLEDQIIIVGANHPSEADLYSAASGTAFRLEGDLTIAGDIFAGASDAVINVDGSGTIGGASMEGEEVNDHLHTDTGGTDFPSIDISPFTPYATNIVDSGSETEGGTFENIRIVSGTNPSFEDGAELKGVIYVESGNQVTFAEDTTITGIIVTESGDAATDEIKFENTAQFAGLDQLPDTAEWSELRSMAGAFLLAPGFKVKFENDSGAVGGLMAAEHFKFENAFVGEIRGGIISYGIEEIKAENGSSFTIDRSQYGSGAPTGFAVDVHLYPSPATYTEQ